MVLIEAIGTWVDIGAKQVQVVAIEVSAHSRRPIVTVVTPKNRRRTIEEAGVEEVVWI